MDNKPSPNKFNSPIVYLILIISLGFGLRYFFQDSPLVDGGKQATQTLFAASFPDEKGQSQNLKQYAGKIVVLNFWASWCEPCREEMPELSKLYETYKDKNLVVLGVAIDDVAAISKFVKETKVSYPLFAADMQGMEIATNLGNNKDVLPYTVIIKADGSVAKTYFGRVTKPLLEETLTKLLK
jgi:thiol-disulfide isomerase/thioredoxin